MSSFSSIVWFRQDLRLVDNPALCAAAARGTVLPIYIHDEPTSPGHHHQTLGGASRWWLHESLTSLDNDLRRLTGTGLSVYIGDTHRILSQLIDQHTIDAVYWNRCYDPQRVAADTSLKAALKERGIEGKSFNASLLWEPWDILKDDGTPYRVFTPFYRRGCLRATPPRYPLPVPPTLKVIAGSGSLTSQTLGKGRGPLLPSVPWYESLAPHWQPGEDGAHHRLATFLNHGLVGYKEGRNYPNLHHVSRLSPHLHFGEISPHFLWDKVTTAMQEGQVSQADGDHFQSELGWREFSHYLVYHFPNFPTTNFQPKFDTFPWRADPKGTLLGAWQRGQTGYPIIDAGMAELWQTGYMHNRIRMVVGSFLVKNLRLPWQHGEAWFWDCLVDADLANNTAGWQWVAGCGADAAPYFRVFNPVRQGEKFDPDGGYTRRYLPVLKNLPLAYLQKPWEAPASVLRDAGVRLGDNYPRPIVDLATSAKQALESFKTIGYTEAVKGMARTDTPPV